MDIDERTEEIFKLLDSLNFESSFNFDKVLDIGVGNCEIAKYFSNRKFTVTGIGLELKSYIDDFEILKSQYNISLIECSIEKMPFEDESFDLIIMSHVMEHCPNIGLALKEVKRVLKKKGKVLVFVPPHSDFICSGHIAMGWNVGQLMYTLLVNGFDVKHNSSFITQNYSIAAYVSKLEIDLPKLRGDKGDIHNLFLANFFPFEVMRKYDSSFDGFDGKILSINWPNDYFLINKNNYKPTFFKGLVKKIFLFNIKFFPIKIVVKSIFYLEKIVNIFKKIYDYKESKIDKKKI